MVAAARVGEAPSGSVSRLFGGVAALVGLGSVIEVSSAAAVAWQFSARDHAVREAREKAALRIIAGSFFVRAAYVTVDAVRAPAGTRETNRSIPGIVLAALSLAVMPVLSTSQRRAGRELGSASAGADSKQTLLCTYRSPARRRRPRACAGAGPGASAVDRSVVRPQVRGWVSYIRIATTRPEAAVRAATAQMAVVRL
ncbi:hypothetical protein ACH4TV_31710 [Streptomyces sp. NPDC020898]|uniref:hypothetical protein n=1 Tax=Streptomyces sp. NPDC020898 TaxID=3365101 RepID=UPI00379A25B3